MRLLAVKVEQWNPMPRTQCGELFLEFRRATSTTNVRSTGASPLQRPLERCNPPALRELQLREGCRRPAHQACAYRAGHGGGRSWRSNRQDELATPVLAIAQRQERARSEFLPSPTTGPTRESLPSFVAARQCPDATRPTNSQSEIYRIAWLETEMHLAQVQLVPDQSVAVVETTRQLVRAQEHAARQHGSVVALVR